MKFDIGKLLTIFAAIHQVEQTIKGSGNKKQKVIDVAKTALGVTGELSPAAAAKLDRFVDDAVEIANGLQAQN